MNPYTIPTIADFKAQFVRDFAYGTDATKNVLDSDITEAIGDANLLVNPLFFSTQDQFTTGFLWLAAHYLVMNLRSSQQGLSGSFSWLVSSRSVGSVSESFSIPQKILDNPVLGLLSRTYYGSKYLMFILPQMVGQVYSVYGGPNP